MTPGRSLSETSESAVCLASPPECQVDDDGLHHVCALHTDDVDDEGACERGEGCRSLCGRDISRVVLTPVPLPGEQPCLVCYQMDAAP